MFSGDEFYDDETTSGFDPYFRADWILDQLRDSFPCRTCGSPDPAIIEGRFCCDCTGDDAEAFQRTRAVRLEASRA